ncbi:hypothetical protein EV424DRAFT_1351821 [Suillus variegatus]|nr:hypothetical protein EV424DRAFT_1351821 [Suillus variegatus]
MRVARQWWQLQLLKWNSFGHESKDRKPGDLALFCPACPQPGINVTLPPEDEQEETNSKLELPKPSWLYSRSLVMDGNFKAEHLYAVNPMDEVSLMDGRAFMVSDGAYKAHLAQANAAVQRSECNNHCAVNQANATRHRLEATGIGGREKGMHIYLTIETLPNKDQADEHELCLYEALKHNAGGIQRALTFYDINCQYHKYLRDCVSDSPFLELDQALEIMLGIGLWHVHGHQDSCYVRYASNFITGAAQIDGEIMETLWVPLNIISPSARGMGTLHRKECLDYQMNNCNFMKMIRMSKALCRKFRQAVKGVSESTAAFQTLNESTDAAKVIEWEEQERVAQQCHTVNPKVMDIYEVQLCRASANTKGTGTAVVGGQWSVSWSSAPGLRFISDGIGDSDIQVMENELLMLDEDQIDEMADEFRLFEPEKMVLPMPSIPGPERCTELGTTELIQHELALWEGQANNALHNIRVHLADKAVIFRTTVRTAKSQAMSTRAWAQVHSVDRALANLGADNELLERYCPLVKEHLKVSTAVADPNARGQRNNTLAWFWSMDVEGDSRNSDWLNECIKDRLEEEHLLVQHEMNWTCNFFMDKAEEWIRLGDLTKNKVGHLAYAAWQCKIYQCLCQDAMDAFNKARDPANRRVIFPKVE